MNASRAFFAGVFSAAIVSLLLAVGRAWGLDMNMSLLVGTAITRDVGAPTWFLGFLVTMSLGGIIGLIYGLVFERMQRSTASGGAAIGFIHAVIAGLLMGLAVPPLIPEGMSVPGVFFSNLGTGAVVVFIALHVVYGMIVGGLYETSRLPGSLRFHRRV